MLISDKMLDKALTMKSLDPSDLMYIFDNYITGEGGIRNLGVTFDTPERRNQAFQHKIGAEEIVAFLEDTIYEYEVGVTKMPEEKNSIQRMIGKNLDDENVKNFISPKSAKIAYNIIMKRKYPQTEYFVSSMIYSPYIFTHREVIEPEHEKKIARALFDVLLTDNSIDKDYQKLIAQRLKDLPKVMRHLNANQKRFVLTVLHSDEQVLR